MLNLVVIKLLTIIFLEFNVLKSCLCDYVIESPENPNIRKANLVHAGPVLKRDLYSKRDLSTSSDRLYEDIVRKARLVHVEKIGKVNSFYPNPLSGNTKPSEKTSATNETSSDDRKASKYLEKECQCGKNSTDYIVGGEPVAIEEYPWTVQLLLKDSLEFFCGGTIINNRYVLTAAHCLLNRSAENILIRYGHESSDKEGKFVKVLQNIPHENFNYSDHTIYDIALVKAAQNFHFSDSVQPICLFPNFNYKSTGVIAGWGHTTVGGNASDVLRAAFVNIMDHEYCIEISDYFEEELNEFVLCGSEEGIDSCQGDSGGPLMAFNEEKGLYSLVGVTSWGFGCADPSFPGVYTNVPEYRDWIFRHTKYATYCHQ